MQALTPAELDVMTALWACRLPARRADIQKRLPGHRAWADTTLLTVLLRLEEKGYVALEKEANHNLYRPQVRRQDHAAAVVADTVQRCLGGSLVELLDALEDAGRLDLSEMEALRRHLEELIAQAPAYGDYYDTWDNG